MSLRCSSHAATSSTSAVRRRPLQAAAVDHGHGGVDDGLVALVEHEQHTVRSVAASTAGRLLGVVQPKHRRRRSVAHHESAGLDAVGERVERVGRPALVGWQRVSPQPDPGDDREGALRAEDQLGEIGTGGGRRCTTGADDGAVGQHGLEADDHVFDLAVAGRVLTGASGRDPAADGGQVEALREVADRQTVLVLERAFEVGSERAGPDLDDAGDLVDDFDAGECRGVEHDTAEHGIAAPHTPLRPPATVSGIRAMLQARATAATCSVVGGSNDHIGQLRDLAGQRPVQGERPPVTARFGDLILVADDLADRRAARRGSRPGARFRHHRNATRTTRSSGQLNGRRRRHGWCRGRGVVVGGVVTGGLLCSAQRPILIEMGVGRRIVPAEFDGHQAGDVRRRGERDAARSSRWARVRRSSTSSRVVAISWRTAYTASARR